MIVNVVDFFIMVLVDGMDVVKKYVVFWLELVIGECF